MSQSLVFGLHAVTALLNKQSERIIRLCVLQNRQDHKIQSLIQLAHAKKVKIEFVSSRHELDHMTNHENHQGVIAWCHATTHTYSEQDLKNIIENTATPFLLILDHIQDPHNLGACLRSADAAGIHAVIAPRDKSVGITPTVSKVACGAAETVPFIQVTNLARTMEFLKNQGIWIYGATATARETLYKAKLTGKIAIALGGEGSGLRRLTEEKCDVLMTIPMHGSVSSLNVSVAAGICLFEAIRQRNIR